MSLPLGHAPRAIPLHASACITPGGVLLFLGHAGAGKSTIVRLLAERFPTLADDAVLLVRQDDGGWHVTDGSSRAFAGPLADHEAEALELLPLRAVVRLYQDSVARLERIGPRDTCRHLADALFEIGWPKRADAEMLRAMFPVVAQVARRAPGWQLYFAEDGRTADLLFGAFGPVA